MTRHRPPAFPPVAQVNAAARRAGAVQPSTNPYAITVRAGQIAGRETDFQFGHTSVVLHAPMGSTEYNVAVPNADQIAGKPLRSLAAGIPGTVQRRSQPVPMTNKAEVTIPLSPQQYQQARQFAESQANRGSYQWHAGNNCTQFANGALRAAGVRGVSTSPYGSPDEMRSQINRVNNSNRLSQGTQIAAPPVAGTVPRR